MAIYHDKSKDQILRKRRFWDVVRWALLVLVIVGVLSYRSITGYLKDQGVASIRNSVLSTAEQCYAIEGAYPPSLQYLVDHYGLSIDSADYQVNYVVFASNIPPTVTVTTK